MPRVALTDEQKARYEVDDLCKSVIESIENEFLVKRRLQRGQTAEALGLHTNTWFKWRTNNLAGCGSFRDVAMALRKAGYKITIEKR